MPARPISIVNVGYRSTNFWVLSAGKSRFLKPADNYTEIRLDDNLIVPIVESRAFLTSLGFDGEFVHTPGHSDDSVSLVLGSGEAFTGDLTHPGMATEEDAEVVAQSWQRLRDHGATTVYAGHGPVRPMPADRQGE